MAKTKISRDKSDRDMLAGFEEPVTFENEWREEAPKAPPAARPGEKDDPAAACLTPELREQLGRALLELKLRLYKEGVVDYRLQVSGQGRQIVLNAVPLPRKEKKNNPS